LENSSTYNIKLKKLTYLYQNLVNAVLAALSIAIFMYFTIKDNIENINLLNIWLGTIVFITILRLISYMLYDKSKVNEQNISQHFTKFFILTFISSILWTLIPFYFFPDNIAYQVLILLMLGGLATGASLSLAAEFKLFIMFLSMSMLPVLFIFYTKNTELTTLVAIVGFLYTLFLLAIAKKVSNSVTENIVLVHNNEELISMFKHKAEEANNANEAKSKFLSVMSHEIRTPLNAIIGFVKILKNSETDKTKQNYLDTIDSSSFLLMSIINDILDVTKIESGNLTIELIEYEPYKELNQLYTLYEKTAKEKNINLVNSISNELPKYFKGDILKLKQIISNLLSNALKFTPDGKNVELITYFNEENKTLYVEIKDNGIGIKKENIHKITQEFTQADNSTARKYGGTGLGLSIVTKLLKFQDSKLNIKSQLGEGSSFYFELPVDVMLNIEKNTHEDIEYKFTNKNILVAEDNKTNQMLIEILLDEMEIDVNMAEDGLEAEEMFKEQPYDLILMDINMPNKNGTDAMRAIKQLNKTIPIIALTANAVSGDKEKYLNEGFDNYLAKPIDNNELAKVLSKYLK